MKSLFLPSCALTILAMTGCASTPTPQYISPNTYQNYDCNTLMSEYNRTTQYINANQQKSGLTMSGVGIGIAGGRHGIYPTVSFGVGKANSGNQNNVSIAMGERDAILQSGRMKQCAFSRGVKLYSEK
ncbi:hypothetical protein [Moraxella boevrei]|uniref:hypothetical protein n=1 Tax=Faucicola boevrei TaxID=346665 RepID=UPI003737092A